MQSKHLIIIRLNLRNLKFKREKPNQDMYKPKTKVPGHKAIRLVSASGRIKHAQIVCLGLCVFIKPLN